MRAKRVDANQKEIVKALIDIGASVQHLHMVGGGCPDLLCGIAGKNLLMEIKDGSKIPSERRLNKVQGKWHKEWGGQVVVVSTVDEAIRQLVEWKYDN